MNWKKWLRWILIALLTPFALLLIAQWTSPWWLDLASVKGQITKGIDRATGGTGRYERVGIRIFPRPRVIVTGLSFGLPGTVDVEARSVMVSIRLLSLFVGRVDPYEVRLIAPRIRLELADTSSAPKAETPSAPFSITTLDASVRAALRAIADRAPGLSLIVDDGRLELIPGRRAPIIADQVDLDLDVGSRAITMKLSLHALRVERVAVQLRVSPSDLSGDGTITLTGARAGALGRLLAGDAWPVDSAMVDLRIDLTLHGLRDAQAKIGITSPYVTAHIGEGRLVATGLSIAITARSAGDSLLVALDPLAIAEPRISVRATLTRDAAGTMVLDAGLGDLDLVTAQRVAAGLAPGVPALRGLPVAVRAGTLAGASLHSRAKDPGDLFALAAMEIDGTLSGVDADVTVFHDLPVRGASLGASLDHGVLSASRMTAQADGLPVRDGTFRIDLTREVPPMNGGAVVDVDLPSAMKLAPRYLPASALAQLAKVHDLRGRVTAAVRIGGNTAGIIPSVVASDLDLSARYDTIAFPVRLQRGTITYTPRAITVHRLGGRIGRSSFDSLTARLTLGGPGVITASEGTFRLAMPELVAWARKQPDLARPLDSVRSVAGAVSVSITQLALPLDSAKLVSFYATATPLALAVDAPQYAPPVTLDGGAIHATERRIDAEGISVNTLDAHLLLAGGTGSYRGGIDSAHATVTGSLGPEALRWVYARAKLDSALRLRGELDIATASAMWHRDDALRASGSVAVRGGPAVEFSLRTRGKEIDIERARLFDAASDATISGQLHGEHFRVGCDGHVAGTSLERLFARAPLEFAHLACSFRAEGEFKSAQATTATGALTAAGIRLPLGLPFPLTIDALDFAAADSTLEVRTLRIASDSSHVDLTGSVKRQGGQLIVDADVRGDTVIIPIARTAPDSSDSASRAGVAAPGGGVLSREEAAVKQSEFYKSIRRVPASGIIRVNLALVKVLHFDVAPFEAAASIEGNQVSFSLKHAAVCGIGLSGSLTIEPDSAMVSAAMTAKKIPVEGTAACLTDQRIDITGTATAQGQFSARAPLGLIRDHLRGQLSFTAKDGLIHKFDALGSALKVINSGKVVIGQASDLGTKGLAYNKAQLTITVSGSRVDLKEFALDASGFQAAAEGSVDFETRKLDVNALFAPVASANWVLSKIPIVRDIFGGSVLAIPVKVRGTIESPTVVPLGPEAVGSRVVGILGNTLKLPTKLVPAGSADTARAAPTNPPPPEP